MLEIIKDEPDNLLSQIVTEMFKKNFFENEFTKYIQYLKEDAQIVPFKSDYDFNPQKVAQEFYNDKFLYPIILLVNNCDSIFNFTSKKYSKIFVPKLEKIEKIAFS